MGTALATLALGYSEITKNGAIEEIVGRSIEALSFSNSSEVLDVRIPIACTALETLAWAYLRRCEHVGRKEAQGMKLDPFSVVAEHCYWCLQRSLHRQSERSYRGGGSHPA